MDEILYITTLTAAEAVYEFNPCKMIEEWIDKIEGIKSVVVPNDIEKKPKTTQR